MVNYMLIGMVLIAFWTGAWYYQYSKKSGTNVLINLYVPRGNQLYLSNPTKKIKGKIKNIDGSDKLYVAKKISKIPLPAPTPEQFGMTVGGYNIVNMIKIGEGSFVYVSESLDISEKLKCLDIPENQSMDWALKETLKAQERNNTEDKSWVGVLKKNIAFLGALVVAIMLVIYVVQWTGDQIDKVHGEVETKTTSLINIADKITNRATNNQQTDSVPVSDDVDKPPGRD